MLKVGLVGVGGISGSHIPAWDAMEDTVLAALCDIRSERLEPYPDKHHYLDFEEMLEKEELDILDICLPTYLHVDFAVKAMKKGIHVICEKPVSLKEEDVDRVYQAAHENHVCFMVAQVLRFWPEYELVKELYESEKYGKLLSGYMGRLNSRPKWSWDNWMLDEKRSGLVPFDLHIHDLDFMIYAFGAPKNIQKHRSRLSGQDYISAVYEFPGFFLTTECSWYAASYPFSASFRFLFEKALVAWEGGKCLIYQNDGSILDLSTAAENDTGDLDLPKTNAYAEEIRYFKDCVKAGRFPDKVKPEELKQVLHILNNL
ncbi:MAG TPA: Gfo/Idh/MocA family oxidoreductase [Candidatus Eisenbergiella merdipullorum]|uniref:Gfo/Idh/MocA family oxidoreductase n=1 Tax=Candidatus Eisenbergiella merdipullorum TaxID=2838553 RepID=A0A9D2I662_9FIRM|nr:Gfo/Idh/MocA family oxidoreductase [Candidatus Eisenbergiella merdipullorum]